MTEQNAEREIIGITISDLRESVERLKQAREGLSSQIVEKEKALRYWETKLNELEGAANGGGQRLPKGEPRRRLIKTLEDHGMQGLSVTRLSEITGMGWSTVRSTLQREEDSFEEKDGIWQLKKPK